MSRVPALVGEVGIEGVAFLVGLGGWLLVGVSALDRLLVLVRAAGCDPAAGRVAGEGAVPALGRVDGWVAGVGGGAGSS